MLKERWRVSPGIQVTSLEVPGGGIAVLSILNPNDVPVDLEVWSDEKKLYAKVLTPDVVAPSWSLQC